jgi:phosphopantothenoylcysteine decarboxylase/phosphopantothenate--cysteine ligase
MEFEPTRDILAGLARDEQARHDGSLHQATWHGKRVIVGFAAETQDLEGNAREKLRTKKADMIVANDVTQDGAGFDVETNIVTLFIRDGREIPLPRMTKLELAHRVLDQVRELQLSGRG